MPKVTIGTTKFGETLDRGARRPIEEPYWVPSTFARHTGGYQLRHQRCSNCMHRGRGYQSEVNLN